MLTAVLPHALQRGVAVLCLAAFGFGQLASAALGVRCTDSSGQSRFEWACVKTASGACAADTSETKTKTGDTHQERHEQPEPCRDQPIEPPAVRAIPTAPSPLLDLVLITVAFAAPIEWCTPVLDRPGSCVDHLLEPDRPPGSLTHLRTIILRV